MGEKVERRLTVITSADVVAYSRLMEADEAGTRAALNAHRRDLIDPKLAEHHGRLVSTAGDSLLVEFESVVAAVQCAIEMQRGMEERNTDIPEDRRMVFRIGINLGEVIVEGEDIHGDGVNVAARLQALAEPGGICVSGKVCEETRHRLDAAFEDLGDQTVKNIARPIKAYAVRESREEPDRLGGESDALPLPSKPSIAVLPFDNMSGDPEQEYFADGLTEDLITALSYQRSFPVIARNSVFAYKGTSLDIKLVGKELGARYLVEGSVRRAGNRVRINAQLIDATTGHHIWAERHDRKLDDLFAVQDEITQRIAGAIEPELDMFERARAVAQRPADIDAWDCFHRGMAYLYEGTKEGHANARKQFAKASEIDPNYSRGYCGLAWTHHCDLLQGFSDSPAESISGLLENARKAVERDDRDTYAHILMGLGYIYSGENDLSVVELEQAVKRDPSHNLAQIVLGFALSCAGRADEGIERIKQRIQLTTWDPRKHVSFGFLASACFTAERYEEAVQWANRSVQQKPDFAIALFILAASLGQLERRDEAREALEKALRLCPAFATADGFPFRFKRPGDRERLLKGFRKASLEE